MRFAPVLLAVAAFSTSASAQVPQQQPDLPMLSGVVAGVQARINADAGKGLLSQQQVSALEGKQKELEDRLTMLGKSKTLTVDEQSAFMQGVNDQQARIRQYEKLTVPVRKVDPSSVPPTTFVTPNGTAIIAPGGMYGNSGVVIPQNGPVMSPAPSNIQQVPASNAVPQ